MTPPKLPELVALKSIIELGAGKLETRVACEVKLPGGDSYPVHVIALPATMRRHCKIGTDVACKLGYYCKLRPVAETESDGGYA